jgi:tol-pal system protein YbgF
MRVHANLVFLGLFLSIAAQAAAPVEERGSQHQPVNTSVPVPQTPAVQAPAPIPLPQSGDVHYQIQILQDEIRTLRGMVEELNYEVTQLKARQMDDYMDLDRRLSAAATGGSSNPVQSSNAVRVGASTETTSTPAGIPATGTPDETEHYSNAYNQLKAGKVPEAIALFKEHYAKYPKGKYVANSHYWLGEIYVMQGQPELARQSFSTVVDNYPAHRKASDSTFKLGQVYYLLGDKAKAKALLEKAASGNDNAARLAKSYLQENF